MKLTPEEQKALGCVTHPAGVFSKPIAKILDRLSRLDPPLCEISTPLQWQRADIRTCPLILAIATPAGKRALRHSSRRPA